ncbi:MAG: hypothetical protein IPI64_14775 [Chloracidobacterium sp.]|nr:hypothetical protein [Chloracidobacterium sp.]
MLGKNIARKFVTLTTLATLLCVSSMIALAGPLVAGAEITVTGQVTVNGQTAVSNSTITSGSSITTAKGSSAVVSLGKLGRVEVQEDTTMSLNFTDSSIIAMLDSGKVRVSTPVGVASTVTTKNATFMGDSAQADNFLVEAECSHSHIDTTSGSATMREGANDKQVSAGTSATAGNLVQTGCKPCMRPGSGTPPAFAGWPWLILVAGAGALTAVLLTGGNDGSGGNGTVVSPLRPQGSVN